MAPRCHRAEEYVARHRARGIVVDGREIRAFVFLSTHRRTECSCNRFLAVLGIPNLSSRSDQVGAWDSAAVSAPGRVGLFAWHRRKLGWLDPSQVRCVREGCGGVVLQPVTRSGGTKLVLAPLSLTTAIAVELRRREGAEQDMCGGGVLVSRVDTAIPLRDPLVTSPIRLVLTRPLAGGAPIGSPTFGCQYLHEQVVDPTFPQTASDGVTVRLVRENPDGSALVRIER